MAPVEDIQALFEQATAAVREDAVHSAIELDINQLQELTQSEHQHLAILFDLAFEEIDTPETASRYLSLEDIRARQKADSSSLTRALDRFERIVQAPFSLKSRGTYSGTPSTSYRQPAARAALKVVPAPARSRLSAHATDTGASALLALAVAAIIIPIVEAPLLSGLLSADDFSLIHLALLVALYLKVFLVTAIVYPCALLVGRGKTPGLARQRIKLVSANGAPPLPSQILVRCLLAPLSLATLSPLAILKGKKTVADILSRTIIGRI